MLIVVSDKLERVTQQLRGVTNRLENPRTSWGKRAKLQFLATRLEAKIRELGGVVTDPHIEEQLVRGQNLPGMRIEEI